MKFNKFMNDYVGVLHVISLILGILIQPLAALLHPLITPIIIILITLGFIKIDLSLLVLECKHWPIQLSLLLFCLIIIPVMIN